MVWLCCPFNLASVRTLTWQHKLPWSKRNVLYPRAHFLVKTGEQFCLIKSKAVKIQCMPYQNLNGILFRKRKKNPKIHIETQEILNNEKKLWKRTKKEALHFLISKHTIQRASRWCDTGIKTDIQINETEQSPEKKKKKKKLCVYGQMILNTSVHNRKKNSPYNNSVGKTGYPRDHLQKSKAGPLPYTIYRIN